MKDLEKLVDECMKEIINAGIVPGKIDRWIINSRARARWGLCKRIKDSNTYEIQISSRLLTDERIDELACKDTIIHEILHTCKDSMKHTGEWKNNADLMNKLYGYNIKRVTSGEEKGVENRKASRRVIANYIYSCKYCGQVVYKCRKCKFTKYYRNYSCGLCGGRKAFERIG